jgi:hypothetical protein
MSQAAHIEQLQNLPLPALVSYAPHTWGWLALLALLLAGAAGYLGRWLYRRHRDRYRHQALAQLAQIQQRLATLPTERQALRELPGLLKRCALSMPQQPPVASLGGSAWQTFLQGHSQARLPADFSQQLAQLAYAPEQHLQQLSAAQINALLSHARAWLEQLHVAV